MMNEKILDLELSIRAGKLIKQLSFLTKSREQFEFELETDS